MKANANRNLAYGLLSLGMLIAASGCNSDDITRSEASARWPGTGNYQYDFNENGCDTGLQTFSNQADYCLALENDDLNLNCAYSARSAEYQTDCGDDFQDNVSQGNTTTTTIFVSTPTPTPMIENPAPANPTVTPYPASPTQPVENLPPVALDLKAQGMNVFIDDYQTDYPAPGELTFQEKLTNFWSQLASAEPELLLRKAQIQQINISTYASFSTATHELTLSVDMTAQDILSILHTSDRVISFEQKNGVSLDLGIEMYGSYGSSSDLNQKMAFFEANAGNLRGSVKHLSLSTSSIYSLYDRTLTLNSLSSATYAQDFAKFTPTLLGVQPFFKMMDALAINVKSTNLFLTTDSDASALIATCRALASDQVILQKLKQSGALSVIELSPGTGINFYESLQQITIPLTTTDSNLMAEVLNSLSQAIDFASESKILVQYPSDALAADFIQSVRNMTPFLAQLKNLQPKINLLAFTKDHSYFNVPGLLVVGAKDAPGELGRVISTIR